MQVLLSEKETSKQRGSLKEIGNKQNAHNQKERELAFLEHIMRKDCLENLTLTGHIEDKRERGKQRVT